MNLTRRTALLQIGAAGVLGHEAFAADLQPTPTEIVGPFYPVAKPLDRDADLTRISGRSGTASGTIVEVSGKVLSRRGAPVGGAQLEIWQANAAGRYKHPSDDNPASLDDNFEGYAVLQTDRHGHYRFLTVKPGGYPGGRRGYRTPHIHFDISGQIDRLVAQMYFPGEPANDTDYFLSNNLDPASVVARELQLSADGIARYRWDIVLRSG